jgi:hypothetical protein
MAEQSLFQVVDIHYPPNLVGFYDFTRAALFAPDNRQMVAVAETLSKNGQIGYAQCIAGLHLPDQLGKVAALDEVNRFTGPIISYEPPSDPSLVLAQAEFETGSVFVIRPGPELGMGIWDTRPPALNTRLNPPELLYPSLFLSTP